MREFSFRFLVADEGIKVDFVQASPTEVIFKVHRNENDNTVIEIREEAISDTTKKSTRHRIDKELFHKLWNEGVSAEIMAEQLGTTANSVYVYACRHGYGKRNNKLKLIGGKQLIPDKLINVEHFIEMWNSGYTIVDIASEFKISKPTVYRWATQIPECILTSERRSNVKQVKPVTTDDDASTPIIEPIAKSENTSSKENWPKTGEKLRQNEVDALCKMWRNDEQNVAYLAKYFGVSKSCIYYQLRVNGCRK